MIRSTIVGLMFCVLTGLYLERETLKQQISQQPKTVRAKMMQIQREVGCIKIDAYIGSETTGMVNAQVKLDEKEMFNQYAISYFEKGK